MGENQARLLATVEGGDIPDNLQVRSVRGREAIGELFELAIHVVAKGFALEPRELLYASLALSFSRDGREVRRLHGVVREIEEHGLHTGDVHSYTLHLVPRAHRLALVVTQDLYFDMSVPDLIAHKLRRVRLEQPAVDTSRLITTYPVRDFVVQYRESDVAFICRLAEHVGISFFFEHDSGEDRLLFVDHNEGFPLDDGVEMAFAPRGDDPGVFEMSSSTKVIPKRYAVMDYNYRTPDVELTSVELANHGNAGGIFEYGTHFKTTAEGAVMARVRAEEAASAAARITGASDLCQLTAGHRYTFTGGGGRDREEWLIVAVEHEYSQQVGIHGGDETPEYQNRFVATPASVPFRPARNTPRPRIHGVIHGVVEPEVWGAVSTRAKIDAEGRYWVKFLFDTVAVGERKASKPVRMAQPNAGPDVGMHFPLRPGVEVIMSFIDGDPDRPIIVGALHNASQPGVVTSANSDHAVIRTGPGTQMKFKGGH